MFKTALNEKRNQQMMGRYLQKWSKDIESKIEETNISSHPWPDIRITIKEFLHKDIFDLIFKGKGQILPSSQETITRIRYIDFTLYIYFDFN